MKMGWHIQYRHDPADLNFISLSSGSGEPARASTISVGALPSPA
jgi:hypothetical protein